MKRIAIVIVIVLSSALMTACTGQAPPKGTVHPATDIPDQMDSMAGQTEESGNIHIVSDPQGFIDAIGPDRIIILEGDGFLLTELVSDGMGAEHKRPDISKSRYVNWEDWYGLVISGVDNLTIRGGGSGRFSLRTDVGEEKVMTFKQCTNLNIENLSAGHTNIPEYCGEGVLSFSACQNVGIRDCGIYGCGVVGMTIYDVDGMTVEDCEIYECSENLLYIYQSRNLQFRKVTFRDTGMYNLIVLDGNDDEGVKNLFFENCIFANNVASQESAFFFLVREAEGITVRRCDFINNNVNALDDGGSFIRYEDCTFDGNNFDNYGAVIGGYWVQMIGEFDDENYYDGYDEAKAILQSWVDSHPFQLGAEIEHNNNLLPSEAQGEDYSDEFYRFYLAIIRLGVAEILVHKETGALFHLDSPYNSVGFGPIDDWYNKDHAGYAPTFSANDARTIYSTWLSNHAEMSEYTLGLHYKIYEDGAYYYWFQAENPEWYWFNILADMETGELLFMMTPDGEDPTPTIEPLDDYYNRYYG